MVMVECTNVGSNTLFKSAALKGTSYYVFIVYSYALSTLALLLLLFIFRRPTGLPPFSRSLFFKICLLGLIGFSGKMFGYAGINYSSPTLSSAISNLTPAYTFILAIIFSIVVHTWGLRLRGPVYVSMFKPLSIAIATAMGIVFLGDTLYLGSIIGAIIISIGFYTVIWAKSKEEMGDYHGVGNLESSSNQKVPLLQSYTVEET